MKLNDDPEAGAVTVLLATGSHDELGFGDIETAVVGDLTIPADIPRTDDDGTGTYYLHFYDDRGRIVNELDETNNSWTEGPIVVESSGVRIPRPADALRRDDVRQERRGRPRLAVHRWLGADRQRLDAPAAERSSTAARRPWVRTATRPEPSWRAPLRPDGHHHWLQRLEVLSHAGMSRPQYTWQFNFDATGLTRGSCYSMYVEVPDIGQVIGSSEEGLEPFGPFSITPR